VENLGIVVSHKAPSVAIRDVTSGKIAHAVLKHDSPTAAELNRIRGHFCLLSQGTECWYTADEKGIIDIKFDVPDVPNEVEISIVYHVLPSGQYAFARRTCGCEIHLCNLARKTGPEDLWIEGTMIQHKTAVRNGKLEASWIDIIEIPASGGDHKTDYGSGVRELRDGVAGGQSNIPPYDAAGRKLTPTGKLAHTKTRAELQAEFNAKLP